MSRSNVRLLHRSISILTTALLVPVCLLAVVMVLPTLLGYERYVIVSGSMEPAIPTGSIVYDEVVPVSDIKVGDIITFVPPPEFDIHDPVTHRVVEITVTPDPAGGEPQRVFRTKGDANADVDAWRMVLDGDSQARVVRHLPYVGYLYMALQKTWVQVLVIGIPAVGIVLYIVITMWRVSGDAVRAEREEAARAAVEPAEPVEEPRP